MPVHTAMPRYHGERELAELLESLDDGKLHLWFDLALPGVANLDIVVYDELVGIFVLETKAVPISALLHFDDSSIEISDRGWQPSPVVQARKACFDLKDYLRDRNVDVPKIGSTVAWPRIMRAEWLHHWRENTFPTGYEMSMVFTDDVRGDIALFRNRLSWIAGNPLWGATPTTGFVHNQATLLGLSSALRPVARAYYATDLQEKDPVHQRDQTPDDTPTPYIEETDHGSPVTTTLSQEEQYGPGIWLGTEYVVDAAKAGQVVLNQAAAILGTAWSKVYAERLDQILDRLEQPFRLGVIGEFRAGKSSLVNAIVGRDVAMVAEMECTFALQRFYYSDEPEAFIVHRDGRVEQVSVGELRTVFQQAYDSRIPLDFARTEVGLPAPILKSIDIWDSPGLGGSEENEETARRFAETVDAAIWVFDSGFAGQVSFSPVIRSLEQNGKTIIAVINKCEYMTTDEANRVKEVLVRSHHALKSAQIVPFSALLALHPESDRDEVSEWAVDSSGNLQTLIKVIREVILSAPGRLTGRAAAGDLRATLVAVRDDIGAAALNVRRSLYLYTSQLKKAEELLEVEIDRIARKLEIDAMLALHDHLIGIGETAIQELSNEILSDSDKARMELGALKGTTLADFLDHYFRAQRGWIEDRLRNTVADCRTSLSNALTPIESTSDAVSVASVGQHACVDADIGNTASTDPASTDPDDDEHSQYGWDFDFKFAAEAAGGTITALGILAFLIPGPQWLVVVPSAIIVGIFAGLKRAEIPPAEELRENLLNEWHKQVRIYMQRPDLPTDMHQAIASWRASLYDAMFRYIMVRLEGTVFDGESEAAYQRRLDQLTALRIQTETVLEQLGNPLFGLPPADDMLSRKITISPNERERTQGIVHSILDLAKDVVAITDGAFSVLTMPLLLEIPGECTIRVLAWEQPLSDASSTFRTELANLRGKRSGPVAVAAPVAVGPSEESLPSGCWIFVPGRAFHFSLPLYETWMASGPVTFEPYEDPGNLYHEHFGRWWNGDVPGYQTLPIDRRGY